jgi:hypothetical protein
MSVTGILGSGFGLYGWLPALLACDAGPIILPQRYRPALTARPELAALAAQVEWLADEEAVLDRAALLALAVRPQDQQMRVAQSLQRPGIKALILEKPLAPTPGEALALHAALYAAGRRFEVGYTLAHTPWAQALRQSVAEAGAAGTLDIRWTFMAHHYRHDLRNWKRSHPAGGGALRFYGIQLLALLALAGYRAIDFSQTQGVDPDDCRSWHARLSGPGLPGCSVAVDSDAHSSQFTLELAGGRVPPVQIRQADPFDGPVHAWGTADRRIGVLAQICSLAGQQVASTVGWYKDTLELWAHAEQMNVHQCVAPHA